MIFDKWERRAWFGGGSAPAPVAPPPAPKIEDTAVQEAASEALRRRRKARGYRSTILRNDMLDSNAANRLETLGS